MGGRAAALLLLRAPRLAQDSEAATDDGGSLRSQQRALSIAGLSLRRSTRLTSTSWPTSLHFTVRTIH